MTKRVVIGHRANGDVGMFVSPPGVDADTAADSALLLSVTAKVSQLILVGHVSGSAAGIVLGLSQRPFVFITSQFDFAGVPGHATGPGPCRPSPMNLVTSSTATINSSGATMDISTSLPVSYFVYGAAF